MRGDEFATARQRPSTPPSQSGPSDAPFADQDGLLPPGSQPVNQFTPISASERLRGTGRRPPRQHTAALPPMVPGQRYGWGVGQQEPDFSPPAYPTTGGESGQGMTQPAFVPHAQRGPGKLQQYQEDYWAQLQAASEWPPPSQGEGQSGYYAIPPTEWPRQPDWIAYQPVPQEELFPMEDWGQTDLYAQTDFYGWPECQYPAYDAMDGYEDAWLEPLPPEGQVYAPVELSGPYQAHGDASPPMREPEHLKVPPKQRTNPAAPSLSDLMAAVGNRLRRAFATGEPDQGSRIGPGRLAMGMITALMLVFCGVQIGKTVILLMENETEMKNVRQEYYAKTGVELAQNAGRVDLLPEGQTFEPTVGPQAQPTGQPALEQQPHAEEAVQSPAETALPPRVVLKQYPDNPLGNIREEFTELRAENPDVVGRLTISSVVDEVVVRRNNTYYLNHNAAGNSSQTGAVFVDEGHSIQRPPENLLLRGQSNFDGKLFQPLARFVTEGVDFVRQNAVFRLNTLYEEAEYVVFAVIVAASDPSSPDYFNFAAYSAFQNDLQMESYVALARQHSIYEIPLDVQAADRLLTLSTLGEGGDKQCLVLIARKLRPGEAATSFSTALKSIRIN